MKRAPMIHRPSGPRAKLLPKGLVILHEDDSIIVVDKPPGLLTMGSATERTRTAYHMLTDYVRMGFAKARQRIFIVHRLDRDTSGVLIFARNEETKKELQSRWEETVKKYLAVVKGRFEERSGIISSYLAENKAHRVYSTTDTTRGRLSRTAYKALKETRNLSLLEVELLTGRKNQIRVHLADMGHPVVGDRKYGKDNEPASRLALHALSISFTHPRSGERVVFATGIPAYFRKLVGNVNLGPDEPDGQ
jgi:tRNA pseudouridine32 synthase/23S rRNA pseudouridine746 synthase/23S rRNA pseudouridine1911/1915/1917 synthase